MPSHPSFYQLSSWGRSDEGDSDERSTAELIGSELLFMTTEVGRRVNSWPSDIRLKIDRVRDLEDMPWVGRPCHVVSDRLRKLFEKYASNHAQFLSVTPYFQKKPTNVGKYWIANWLHTCDCLDKKNTEYLEDGSISVESINPKAIPNELQIFRIIHSLSMTVIRDSLRKILENEGITGCQFYDVRQTQ